VGFPCECDELFESARDWSLSGQLVLCQKHL
jgi:hypothetical protein